MRTMGINHRLFYVAVTSEKIIRFEGDLTLAHLILRSGYHEKYYVN